MTNFLRQQRIASFALGTSAAAALYLETKVILPLLQSNKACTLDSQHTSLSFKRQRFLVRSALDTAYKLPGGSVIPADSTAVHKAQPEFWGPSVKAFLVSEWNKGIDAIFKPVIDTLVKKDL